ncbi:unnamed protein product [Scytosiphon promiscuus]
MAGPRAACGRAWHGKSVAGDGIPECYGCGRPGSRDGCSSKWKHIGDSEYWAELVEWSTTVSMAWTHKRDLRQDPFKVGECICCRPDCVAAMYKVFKTNILKQETGSLGRMEIGQASPMGRYPSTSPQVRALLEHASVDGSVLDCCGAAADAVSCVMAAHGFRVTTNDLNPMLMADSHMDAATDEFRDAFRVEARRPDWVVSSPPYKNAFAILKQALRIGRVGVAFKLRLTFLEPTKTRGRWLRDNPPNMIVVLARATYRGRKCSSTEAWFVWTKAQAERDFNKPAFFFALP